VPRGLAAVLVAQLAQVHRAEPILGRHGQQRRPLAASAPAAARAAAAAATSTAPAGASCAAAPVGAATFPGRAAELAAPAAPGPAPAAAAPQLWASLRWSALKRREAIWRLSSVVLECERGWPRPWGPRWASEGWAVGWREARSLGRFPRTAPPWAVAAIRRRPAEGPGVHMNGLGQQYVD
jgi:hypothetical protein